MAELPTKLHLTVVTRDRKVLETECDEVVLPGVNGYLGILPGHTPLLALLKIGVLSHRTGTAEQRIVLSWGFAEVLPNRVIVLAQNAYLADELDASALEKQRLEARARIDTLVGSTQNLESLRAEIVMLEQTRNSIGALRHQLEIDRESPPRIVLIEKASIPEGNHRLMKYVAVVFAGLFGLLLGVGGVIALDVGQRRLNGPNETSEPVPVE